VVVRTHLAYIIAWWMNFEPHMLAKSHFFAQSGSFSVLQENNYQQNALKILNDTSHFSNIM